MCTKLGAADSSSRFKSKDIHTHTDTVTNATDHWTDVSATTSGGNGRHLLQLMQQCFREFSDTTGRASGHRKSYSQRTLLK